MELSEMVFLAANIGVICCAFGCVYFVRVARVMYAGAIAEKNNYEVGLRKEIDRQKVVIEQQRQGIDGLLKKLDALTDKTQKILDQNRKLITEGNKKSEHDRDRLFETGEKLTKTIGVFSDAQKESSLLLETLNTQFAKYNDSHNDQYEGIVSAIKSLPTPKQPRRKGRKGEVVQTVSGS